MLNSPVDEIKNRLDVVDIVGQYIKLQKAGVNYRAVCPFHSEKKPSLFVSPARQIWHCFGCGKGGDLIGFIKEIEGLEFGDALRILAQKAGVELKREDPKIKTKRQRLYDACELATKFFEKQLVESVVGREAKNYLLGRGVSEESIKKWRIGYAPDGWNGLIDFLTAHDFTPAEAVEAGLAIKKAAVNQQSGAGYFDRFRGRIMFPICDLQGQAVGFSGRVFKTEDPAKYVNTPSTLLYDKSRILYGLDKSRLDLRRKDFCILVEGQMDAIMVSQAGHENVVATSGTALTPYQLKILKRYTDKLLTAFDMDIAGDTATKRGIALAQAQGFNVSVIMMPKSKDPADIVAEDPDQWPGLIANARSIMDFYFESAFAGFDASRAEGKKEIAKIILPLIKRIPNAIEKAHWRQRLAQELGVKEEDVEAELKNMPAKAMESYGAEAPEAVLAVASQGRSRRHILEERIIAIILKYKHQAAMIEEKYLDLFSPEMRSVIESISRAPSPEIAFALGPANVNPRLQYLVLRAESDEEENSDEEAKEELLMSLRELYKLDTRKHLTEMVLAIRTAEQQKRMDDVKLLMEEFQSLTKGMEDF